jgi:hypothetical protein
MTEEPRSVEEAQEVAAELPSFLQRRLQQTPDASPATDPDVSLPGPKAELASEVDNVTGGGEPREDPAEIEAPMSPPVPESEPETAPKPHIIAVPPLPAESDMPAEPAVLTAVNRMRKLNKSQVDGLLPLMARLTEVRDRMAAASNSSKDGI